MNKSKRQVNKLVKKAKRAQLQLKDENISVTDVPTENIVVCNAGLSNGLNEDCLVDVASKYGNIDKILMLSGKSYCFIVFADLESSISAYENIHTKLNIAQDNKPLFLSYVESVPMLEDTCLDLPEGLKVYENFVSEDEETLLLNCINWNNCGTMKHRRVNHYGYEFIYGKNNIDLKNPLDSKIPQECNILWKKCENLDIKFDNPPDQLTVNEYKPGQGIPSHIDTHSAFFSPILSLSLGSSLVMEFKCEEKKVKVLIPQRSLLVMDGASRYKWSHGIVPRNYDLINGRSVKRGTRTSFTFRWVRQDAKCDCSYNEQCDTYNLKNAPNESEIENLAHVIEQQHVHKVYGKIATHFSETRSKIWPSVQNFINSLAPISVLTDLGCGNGKNLKIRDDLIQIGLEYNESLAEISKSESVKRNSICDVLQADCLYLPLKSNVADAFISIAVYHHFVTEKRRLRAIEEAVRILKPGGQGLISVWARDQNKNCNKTSYLKQCRKNRSSKRVETEVTSENRILENITDSEGISVNITLPVHTNRTDFQHQDVLVPWKLKEDSKTSSEKTETFMRFYHVFEENELENLCKSINNIDILDSFYEQGNWCVIIKKND